MERDDVASLRAVHADLVRLLAELEAETARPAPNMANLATVRLQLTRASRRRGDLFASMAKSTAIRSDDIGSQLNAVRAGLQDARVNSAHHIGVWTTQAVQADWKGYQEASRIMRGAMRAQIEREACLLRAITAQAADPADNG